MKIIQYFLLFVICLSVSCEKQEDPKTSIASFFQAYNECLDQDGDADITYAKILDLMNKRERGFFLDEVDVISFNGDPRTKYLLECKYKDIHLILSKYGSVRVKEPK